MDPAALMREIELYGSRIEVSCQTCWMPDEGLPRVDAPPDFYAVVFGGALAYLSPAASLAQPLERATLAELLALARAAVAPPGVQGRGGVDTADGRPWTTLRLAVECPNGAGRLVFGFSHYHSERRFRCEPLRALLAALRAQVARACPAAAPDAWDLLLSRLRRAPPEARWAAGEVVPLDAGARVDLDAGGRFYLRLGQPPGPSQLYRVAPTPAGLEVVQLEPGTDAGPVRIACGTWWRAGAAAASDPGEARVRRHPDGDVEVEAGWTGRRVYIQRAP